MKQPLLIKYVLPFLLWYSVMILTALIIDLILHYFNLVAIGRYLGFVGTFLIVVSFIYSLRKRKIIVTGSPQKLLIFHEYLAIIGSIMILVHAGIHFNAILPWLATFLLLISVASGLVGKFLLQKSAMTLIAKKQDLIKSGLSKEEADKAVFFDSITVNIMKKWRVVHLPISMLLGLLSLLHIITVIMFVK